MSKKKLSHEQLPEWLLNADRMPDEVQADLLGRFPEDYKYIESAIFDIDLAARSYCYFTRLNNEREEAQKAQCQTTAKELCEIADAVDALHRKITQSGANTKARLHAATVEPGKGIRFALMFKVEASAREMLGTLQSWRDGIREEAAKHGRGGQSDEHSTTLIKSIGEIASEAFGRVPSINEMSAIIEVIFGQRLFARKINEWRAAQSDQND